MPATTLLDDLPGIEAQLLQSIASPKQQTIFKPLYWETAGAQVYIPMWRQAVAPFAAVLQETGMANLPSIAIDGRQIANAILNPPGTLLNGKQRQEQANGILSMAFALALIDNGWKLKCQPASFILVKEHKELVARDVLARLRSGQLAGET